MAISPLGKPCLVAETTPRGVSPRLPTGVHKRKPDRRVSRHGHLVQGVGTLGGIEGVCQEYGVTFLSAGVEFSNRTGDA